MSIKAIVTITYKYVVDVPNVLVDSVIAGENKEAAVDYAQRIAQQRHKSNCKYSDDAWDSMQMEWDVCELMSGGGDD
jgi:hypothetical protein